MLTETKVWGKVQHVFGSDSCAVSVLDVNAGYRCSRHYHKHRVNRFIVHSGEIDVILHHQGITHRLKAGDIYDVEPGVVHSFSVIKSGVVVEVYWPAPVRMDDIIREDLGGKT